MYNEKHKSGSMRITWHDVSYLNIKKGKGILYLFDKGFTSGDRHDASLVRTDYVQISPSFVRSHRPNYFKGLTVLFANDISRVYPEVYNSWYGGPKVHFLFSAPFVLFSAPFVLFSAPFVLFSAPFVLFSTPFVLFSAPFVLFSAPFVWEKRGAEKRKLCTLGPL